jgi:hypothetical protein
MIIAFLLWHFDVIVGQMKETKKMVAVLVLYGVGCHYWLGQK